MPILTLTTDFGINSYDVAALKGKLMRASAALQIVDVSNNIIPFDKIGAAFAMAYSCIHFPDWSIHFSNINLKEINNRILILVRNQQYYICPDNGLATLMFPDEDFKAYILQGLEKDFSYLEMHEKLCEIVRFAEKNHAIEQFGIETNSYARTPIIRASITEDFIKASVIYVDRFHNAVININKQQFYDFVKDRPFTISNRKDRIRKISKHYSDAQIGDMLCLFNESGMLEIAINNGKASHLLGLEYGNIVIIEKD